MGVAAEIAQHLHGSAEGGLGIDNPVMSVQTAQESSELLGIGESDCRSGAAKLMAAVKTLEASEELAAKDAAEDLYG